jgi:putative transposase
MLSAMPDYRRYSPNRRPVFLTVKTLPAQPELVEHHAALRRTFEICRARHAYEIIAVVLLPDHFHLLMGLPPTDEDFSQRVSVIKALFSKSIAPRDETLSASRKARRERGLWQRRFYDHVIRDQADLQRHVDYIHINPVKHGYVARPADWPHSSFHRYVRDGIYPPDWASEGKPTSNADFGE